MSVRRVEYLVIGGGLLGLATARALERRGREVLVLEATTVGHERSGSKGTARIFRLGYPDPFYVQLALEAQAHWRRLEAESGRSLLTATGQVDFGQGITAVAEALSAAGAPFAELAAAELHRRWPGFSVDGPVLYEPSSGVLAAHECLGALRQGVEVLEGHAVTALRDDGRRVEVDCAAERFEAQVAVVCAGAKSAGLLTSSVRLPLEGSLEQVAYFALPPATPALPVLIEWGSTLLYGLPEPGGLYKMAFHGGGPPADIDTATLDQDPAVLGALRAAAGRLFGAGEPVGAERCFYDNTADTDFVVDRLGQVVIGAGTSGHGFKFGPLLGELLADLAVGVTPRTEISRFSLSRSSLR